jgi:hypothetical protein
MYLINFFKFQMFLRHTMTHNNVNNPPLRPPNFYYLFMYTEMCMDGNNIF